MATKMIVTDPLSRTTTYGWCTCGALTSMTDANSHVTTFNRDLESRLSSKVYQDSTQSSYTYDTVGRLATMIDARNDVTTESYNLDNTVAGSSYALGSGSSAVLPANVTYGYDTVYNRLLTVAQGGTTTTTYNYNAITGSVTTGAGRVGSVVNALTGGSATINYSYDEWGRVVARNVDGSSNNNVATTFDSLGRVTGVNITPLGNFTYSYFDPTHPTSRLGVVTYPNSQSATFNYLGYTADERLSEIKNLNSSSAVVSQFDYTYNAVGDITGWQQQSDSGTPLLNTEGYDAADQLTSSVRSNAVTGAVVANDGYGYDSAGNRTRANLAMQTASFNNVNQATSIATANPTSFTGSINEPASLTINGYPVTLGGGNSFSTSLLLPPGTTTIPIVATDSAGDQQINKYQFTVSAASTASPTYDSDGNMLTNGSGTSYQWDVLNRLIKITYSGGATSNFAYDGLGRRISIIEKNSGGTTTSTKQLVWDGSQIVEERNASNVVQKRFYPQGEQISGSNYYYTKDHLGSVREMTNSSGTIVARYDYDSYGRTTLVSGTNLSDFQYAGMYLHQPSGLNLTMYRAYNPNTARWLSRDPLPDAERRLGPNLYEYVGNDPLRLIDPLGLYDYNASETFNQFIAPAYNGATSGIVSGVTYIRDSSTGSDDFGHNDHSNDTFCAGGRRMDANQFGNFIAGYKGAVYDAIYWYSPVPAGSAVIVKGVQYHMAAYLTQNPDYSYATDDPFDTTGIPDIINGENYAYTGKACP